MTAINVLVFIITIIINYTKGIFGHTTKPESKSFQKVRGCVEAEIKLEDGLWKVDTGLNG